MNIKAKNVNEMKTDIIAAIKRLENSFVLHEFCSNYIILTKP